MNNIFYLVTIVLMAVYSFFHTWISEQKDKKLNKNSKYQSIIDKLSIIDKYAMPIVASVAVNPNITKSDSMSAATAALSNKLDDLGITDITDKTMQDFLEKAYQQYKRNGGDSHTATTTVDSNAINTALDNDQDKGADANGK